MPATRNPVLPPEACSLRPDSFQVSAEHLTNLNTVHACVCAVCANSLLSRVEKKTLVEAIGLICGGFPIKL